MDTGLRRYDSVIELQSYHKNRVTPAQAGVHPEMHQRALTAQPNP